MLQFLGLGLGDFTSVNGGQEPCKDDIYVNIHKINLWNIQCMLECMRSYIRLQKGLKMKCITISKIPRRNVKNKAILIYGDTLHVTWEIILERDFSIHGNMQIDENYN